MTAATALAWLSIAAGTVGIALLAWHDAGSDRTTRAPSEAHDADHRIDEARP